MRAADRVLDQVREANGAKRQLKILESDRDKLLGIVYSMEDEAGEKSEYNSWI